VFEDGTSGITAANTAGAGSVVLVYDEKLDSPLTESTHVSEVHHDLSCWKDILSRYEILR
jgi:beta-phosphoglucomutase-like phosphatase (HAD superfamily)